MNWSGDRFQSRAQSVSESNISLCFWRTFHVPAGNQGDILTGSRHGFVDATLAKWLNLTSAPKGIGHRTEVSFIKEGGRGAMGGATAS